jgi:hypothetical protein
MTVRLAARLAARIGVDAIFVAVRPDFVVEGVGTACCSGPFAGLAALGLQGSWP